MNAIPERLVNFVRDGLIETEHFGYVVRCSKEHTLETVGDDKNLPVYLRSCAKPLQAALIIDYGLDTAYDMTSAEIALCCASHAGENVHTNVVKSLLDKFGCKVEDLKCGIHSPLSERANRKLILNDEQPSQLHNNCSGKHTMMLGLCRLENLEIENYDDINHPLQQKIKKRIYDLCELKKEYPITKDGCGVPIHSMPLANMVKGYLNLFCNPKYSKIKDAFLNNPYLIGGENRTDTKIIENSQNIIAKVGAGGLIIIINTEAEEGFALKMCDGNMQAREIAAINFINNLHWANISVNRDICTNHGNKVGEIVSLI